MCPLWPLHYVVMYALLLLPLFFCLAEAFSTNITVKFSPDKLTRVVSGAVSPVDVQFSDLPLGDHVFELSASSVDTSETLVTVEPRAILLRVDTANTTFRRAVNVTALNLGYASVKVRARQDGNNVGGRLQTEVSSLPVSIIRNEVSSRLDMVFGICVAVLMAVTYVNMGCTLDLEVIRDCIVRPVGPAIGLLCQYLIMPLAGYSLALASGTDASMQLAVFVTGCSPGGGASNIWTYLLRGNVNLSVTMTLISSLLAFAAVPAWVFCLGRTLVGDSDLLIPYSKILTLLISLVVPCAIGILIRRKLPKVANILTRLLKPWSVILFVFILSFGVYCNLHLWGYIRWNLVLSAGFMPLLGFIAGAVASRLCRRSLSDTIAISIETGVQNTGVAIYMLKFSLPEPANDIAICRSITAFTYLKQISFACFLLLIIYLYLMSLLVLFYLGVSRLLRLFTVAPIIVASMTPLPLFTAMIVSRVYTALYPTPSPTSSPLVAVLPSKNDDSSDWLNLNKDSAITGGGVNGLMGGVNVNEGGVNDTVGGANALSRDSDVRSV